RPRLREQRGANRPLASNAESGQKPENQEMPPAMRKTREPGEESVRQDRERQRAATSEKIAEAAEETAAQRPAEEKPALDDARVPAHAGIAGALDGQELRDERRIHQRVKVHVEAVEGPS